MVNICLVALQVNRNFAVPVKACEENVASRVWLLFEYNKTQKITQVAKNSGKQDWSIEKPS